MSIRLEETYFNDIMFEIRTKIFIKESTFVMQRNMQNGGHMVSVFIF